VVGSLRDYKGDNLGGTTRGRIAETGLRGEAGAFLERILFLDVPLEIKVSSSR